MRGTEITTYSHTDGHLHRLPLVVAFLCLVLSIVVLTSTSTSAQTTANVVVNSSFESKPTGLDEDLIPGWKIAFRQPGGPSLSHNAVELVAYPRQAHTGSRCVRMVNLDRSLGYTLLTSPLQLVPGARYEVSFWARGKAGSQVFAAIWEIGLAERFRVTPEWQRYSKVFVCTGSSVMSIPLGISAVQAGYQGNVADPELFIDDVRFGEVTCGLADAFGEHMVLQRDKRVPVWGWAKAPGQKVTVSFHGQSKSTVADENAQWKVLLDPMPAGGPFEMSLAGTPATLVDVMVGDVWLCTGQSNMDYGVDLVNGMWNHAPEVIAEANHPNIRLWSAADQISITPQWGYKRQSDWQARWMRCTSENVAYGRWGGFSAVGYFFGREIQQDTGVPIGLMKIDFGGTGIEAWMSKEALSSIRDVHLVCPKLSDVLAENPRALDAPQPKTFNTTSACFNGMIAPVLPYAVKGIVWYQGEHNSHANETQYERKLKALIADLRRRLGQGDIPYLIVQLCNYKSGDPREEADMRWQRTREAQFRVARSMPAAALAVTYDLAEKENTWQIHPRDKQDVAHRLALAAKALVYGKRIEYSGPIYRKMAIGSGKIRLFLDHTGSGLMARDGRLVGFYVAGEDRKFVPAEAVIDGKEVVVYAKSVDHPVAVRYCYQSFIDPLGNLYNKEGLPASPFRTDSWRDE